MKEEFSWIKDQFLLNPNERRGIIFSIALLVIISTANASFRGRSSPVKNSSSLEDYRKENQPEITSTSKQAIKKFNSKVWTPIEAYQNEIEKPQKLKASTQKKTEAKKEFKIINLDPNRPKRVELEQLNISKHAINSWFKYLESGGTFHSAEDVKKIYGLSEQEFKSIENYLRIESTTKVKSNPAKFKVELNSANTEELKGLKGIGPVFSERIVKYRHRLGGFVEIGQIKEVYGISDSLFQALKPYITLVPVVSKIKINDVEFKELLSHPYVDYKMAKTILRYRLQHGNFEEVNSLYEIKSLSVDKLNKILPYITI